MKLVPSALVIGMLSTVAASAEQRPTVGYARLFSNDFFGDGQDRWRTGSYALSILKKRGDPVHSAAADVLEYRLRAEIVAPSNLARPSATDRPYAGILSFGVHHHSKRNGFETDLGLDLVTVGDQTGLLDFQRDFHGMFGGGNFGPVPQIGDAIYPTLLGELAKPITLSEFASVRPFVEAQVGVETFIRTGVDLELGRACQGQFMVRDVTTGQRYTGFTCQDGSFTTASLGIDVAHVFDSHYFPSSSDVTFAETRPRVRLGIHRVGRNASVFYGLTWLGEEFKGQPESQVVGSISINLRF